MYKIAGACTVCNQTCFEVLQTWGNGERYPGEPKRLGRPEAGAVRITFLLLDGSKADLTFCGDCAELLAPSQYTDIWRKVMRSWDREMRVSGQDPNAQDWYVKQFGNGLLVELNRTPWTEISNA